MKTDTYTKGILTVIAVALTVIAVRGIAPIGPALAQSDDPIRVTICDDFFSTRCASVSGDDRLEITAE